MRKINSKVADDSVWIKGPKIKIGWGSAPALDLFSCLYGIIGDDIFTVQGKLWSNPRLYKIGGEDIKYYVKRKLWIFHMHKLMSIGEVWLLKSQEME